MAAAVPRKKFASSNLNAVLGAPKATPAQLGPAVRAAGVHKPVAKAKGLRSLGKAPSTLSLYSRKNCAVNQLEQQAKARLELEAAAKDDNDKPEWAVMDFEDLDKPRHNTTTSSEVEATTFASSEGRGGDARARRDTQSASESGPPVPPLGGEGATREVERSNRRRWHLSMQYIPGEKGSAAEMAEAHEPPPARRSDAETQVTAEGAVRPAKALGRSWADQTEFNADDSTAESEEDDYEGDWSSYVRGQGPLGGAPRSIPAEAETRRGTPATAKLGGRLAKSAFKVRLAAYVQEAVCMTRPMGPPPPRQVPPPEPPPGTEAPAWHREQPRLAKPMPPPAGPPVALGASQPRRGPVEHRRGEAELERDGHHVQDRQVPPSGYHQPHQQAPLCARPAARDHHRPPLPQESYDPSRLGLRREVHEDPDVERRGRLHGDAKACTTTGIHEQVSHRSAEESQFEQRARAVRGDTDAKAMPARAHDNAGPCNIAREARPVAAHTGLTHAGAQQTAWEPVSICVPKFTPRPREMTEGFANSGWKEKKLWTPQPEPEERTTRPVKSAASCSHAGRPEAAAAASGPAAGSCQSSAAAAGSAPHREVPRAAAACGTEPPAAVGPEAGAGARAAEAAPAPTSLPRPPKPPRAPRNPLDVLDPESSSDESDGASGAIPPEYAVLDLNVPRTALVINVSHVLKRLSGCCSLNQLAKTLKAFKENTGVTLEQFLRANPSTFKLEGRIVFLVDKNGEKWQPPPAPIEAVHSGSPGGLGGSGSRSAAEPCYGGTGRRVGRGEAATAGPPAGRAGGGSSGVAEAAELRRGGEARRGSWNEGRGSGSAADSGDGGRWQQPPPPPPPPKPQHEGIPAHLLHHIQRQEQGDKREKGGGRGKGKDAPWWGSTWQGDGWASDSWRGSEWWQQSSW